MTFVIFDALIFLILAFILFAVSTTGRQVMSVQETIDAVVAQLAKARAEIVQARDELLAGIAEVQEQLDSVEDPDTPARDLAALTRRLLEIANEIAAIEAQQELAEDSIAAAAALADEPFDCAAI